MHDFLAAKFGFTSCFNRTVAQLATEGGSELSAAQGRLYFGDALFLTVDPKTVRTRLRDNFLDGNHPRWIGRHFLDGGDWRPILLPWRDRGNLPAAAAFSRRSSLPLLR